MQKIITILILCLFSSITYGASTAATYEELFKGLHEDTQAVMNKVRVAEHPTHPTGAPLLEIVEAYFLNRKGLKDLRGYCQHTFNSISDMEGKLQTAIHWFYTECDFRWDKSKLYRHLFATLDPETQAVMNRVQVEDHPGHPTGAPLLEIVEAYFLKRKGLKDLRGYCQHTFNSISDMEGKLQTAIHWFYTEGLKSKGRAATSPSGDSPRGKRGSGDKKCVIC